MKNILMGLLLLTSNTVFAQNYKLETNSDLLDNCGFMHKDRYSFTDALVLIQELIKTKFEGDRACSAPMAQLNSQIVELDNFFNQPLSDKDKKDLAQDAQRQYLIDLESELTLLDPLNPDNAARISVLTSLKDTVKQSISTLGVEAQLGAMEDSKNQSIVLSQKWKNIYANSTAALTTLNSLPPNCIDKMGGWKNMIPLVMKLGASAGPLVGGVVGPLITAGFEAGGQMAQLLRNNRIKRALSETLKVQNAQIIACTYSMLQTSACELEKVTKLMSDKKRVLDLMNQRVTNTRNAEYEAYFLQVSKLGAIQEIFEAIGSMGSALTLDLDLTARYFSAMRLDAKNIKDIPGPNATDSERSDFLIKMKAKGLVWSEYNMTGGPASLSEQVTSVKTLIENASSIIDTAIKIMTEKRSFYDLKGELIRKNSFIVGQLKGLLKLTDYYLSASSTPTIYRADLKSNQIMLKNIISFVDYQYLDNSDEAYEAYLKNVDLKGASLFELMSKGSIAQITTQTVLLIPAKAFERFNRSFKNLERMFITNDITHKDDPDHASYTDFVITRSMQSKFELYPVLHGSSEAFRDNTYLAAKLGLEKGFKREIINLVRTSMKSSSEILTTYKGKTAAHMCALYASFLRDNAPALFSECQTNYKTLGLYPILSEANRPTEMTVNYGDPCFYNSYKQEEEGQRRLFEKLIDYGSQNNLTLGQ